MHVCREKALTVWKNDKGSSSLIARAASSARRGVFGQPEGSSSPGQAVRLREGRGVWRRVGYDARQRVRSNKGAPGPLPKARRVCANARGRSRRTLWVRCRRRGNRPTTEIVEEMNCVLRGWGHYFHYGHPQQAMARLNYFAAQRLRKWLVRRRRRPARTGQPVGIEGFSPRVEKRLRRRPLPVHPGRPEGRPLPAQDRPFPQVRS